MIDVLLQVVFLVAVFTTLATLVLRDEPPPWLRLAMVPALVLVCLSIFLVTIYSGGLRSRDAHAHVSPPLAADGSLGLPRREPESVLSHAVSIEELMRSLRGDFGPYPAQARIVEISNGGGSASRTFVVDTFESQELPDNVADAAQALLRRSGTGAMLPTPSWCQVLLFCAGQAQPARSTTVSNDSTSLRVVRNLQTFAT